MNPCSYCHDVGEIMLEGVGRRQCPQCGGENSMLDPVFDIARRGIFIGDLPGRGPRGEFLRPKNEFELNYNRRVLTST